MLRKPYGCSQPCTACPDHHGVVSVIHHSIRRASRSLPKQKETNLITKYANTIHHKPKIQNFTYLTQKSQVWARFSKYTTFYIPENDELHTRNGKNPSFYCGFPTAKHNTETSSLIYIYLYIYIYTHREKHDVWYKSGTELNFNKTIHITNNRWSYAAKILEQRSEKKTTENPRNEKWRVIVPNQRRRVWRSEI